MSKIKVVQIFSVLSDRKMATMLLDDKGRVWVHLTNGEGGDWGLLDLPDEPLTKEEE